MACPVCPAAGWLGGWIGGYMGIDSPQHPGGRLLSALITANLISITVIAMKSIWNISLCKGGGFTIENIVRVGLLTLPMGVIYSIGVNVILNRFVFSSDSGNCSEPAIPPCCCKK